ncbi:hypothetical protein MCW_01551 [Cardidatus Bartonella washoeensis 085-0475]|uniref:Uncharacterized protein n=1 Tax=Cardidatus Bartonella washoeensis 085-0475 TaxID=1094564 RepID=J1JEK9_9HYPH|nr:hypothetical protein MCW_01551 [Bartonella washoeensis 085-0475]
MVNFVFTHKKVFFIMHFLIGDDLLRKMKFKGNISHRSCIFVESFSIVHNKERFLFIISIQKLKELFTGAKLQQC